jgi:hypothetical protein
LDNHNDLCVDRFVGDRTVVSKKGIQELSMRAKSCFFMSVVCGVIAGGMAIAQTDYYCMTTPVSPGSTQCGCPTVTVEDFCAGSRPMPGMNLITYYYCVGWTGETCTPNTRSCGGKVWKCEGCSCADPGNQSGCNGSNCTLSDKQDFCTGTYGCS